MTDTRTELMAALAALRHALIRAGGDGKISITVSPRDAMVIRHAMTSKDMLATMRELPDPTMVANIAGIEIRWRAEGRIHPNKDVSWR